MRRDNVIERIRAKDYTLWKPKPDEIVNRLGWLEAPSETLHKLSDICAVIEPLKNNFSDIALLGIGGSSLAADVFGNIFEEKRAIPAYRRYDGSCFISDISQKINLQKSLFIVSSSPARRWR